jgi:hypothetical protein
MSVFFISERKKAMIYLLLKHISLTTSPYLAKQSKLEKRCVFFIYAYLCLLLDDNTGNACLKKLIWDNVQNGKIEARIFDIHKHL